MSKGCIHWDTKKYGTGLKFEELSTESCIELYGIQDTQFKKIILNPFNIYQNYDTTFEMTGNH